MKIFTFLTFFSVLQAIETLQFSEEKVLSVSSFDSTDMVVAFSQKGEFIWVIPLRTKVLSFKENGGNIYIHSKARDGNMFFLSCFDGSTGKYVWEKPIMLPKTPPNNDEE